MPGHGDLLWQTGISSKIDNFERRCQQLLLAHRSAVSLPVISPSEELKKSLVIFPRIIVGLMQIRRIRTDHACFSPPRWHRPCYVPFHETGRNHGRGQAEKRGMHGITGNENQLDRKRFMKGGKAGKQGEKAGNHQQRN